MSESKESSTLHELEMSELPQGSPEEVIKDAPAPARAQGQWMCNIKRCMFLILLVISSTVLIAQINAADSDDPPIIPPQDFTFLVYCPYSFKDKARPVLFDDTESGELRRRRLYQAYSYSVQLLHPETLPEHDWTHTYVVEMRSILNKTSNKSKLYYCGLVTNFGEDCNKTVFQACSSPGPMFDLNTSQHADIIWVNNLNEEYFINSRCMTIESKDPHCKLMAKYTTNLTQTFVDPTDQQMPGHQQIQIKSSEWPATAHVHGAEVRPTFDGNPLSWVSNNGSRGVGAFSLSDKCYYETFDQQDSSKNNYMPPEVKVQRIEDDENITALPEAKVNRYPNIQNPGNLWYHDHSMRLTLYNVQNGLSGLYMLRDQDVQKEIGVAKKNEKLVMMTTDGWKATQNLQSSCEVVNRFRFLNNNFQGGQVFRVFFSYGGCDYPDQKMLIPFTIIGADSSLFNSGIENQLSFVIAQAERMEILIKFDSSHENYSICNADPQEQFPPKRPTPTQMAESARLNERRETIEGIKLISSSMEFYIPDSNTRKDIKNVKLAVPYTDFRKITEPISVKRMRPLIMVNSPKVFFSINGRFDFHAGKSENPTIGTYEDWYLINTMDEDHPIHVHLINFQVVKVLNLRLTPSKTCTIYEIDFLAKAMIGQPKYTSNTRYFPFGAENETTQTMINYDGICQDKDSLYNSQDFKKRLLTVNVENVKDQKNISGIDVEKQLTNDQRRWFDDLNITLAPGASKKYVTSEETDFKQYYRRWKDTALVEAFKVFVYRIRWAKSSYAGENDTPFHVPVDQLREYPGFVYHCHILFHEDNEMMRPIMLQLPSDTKLNPKTRCNDNPSDYSWATKVACINDNCARQAKL